MAAVPATEVPTIGHNNPPEDPLLDRLMDEHAGLIKRRDELLAGAGRAPGSIDDEETAGKMADFVQKQIDPFLKRAKDVHQSEKEPFLSGGRTVDGFWHKLVDDIEKAKTALNARRKAYADKKAAEERRRREEEARKAEEEARIARAYAAEEERKRIAAEQEAERQRQEAEAARRREAEAEAARLKSEGDLAAAIEREEQAKRDRAAEDERRAEAARRSEEEARIAREEAERLDALAAAAAKAAAAKPAELGKSRGNYGGQTSLKQFINFKDLDRAKIDLETLRFHFSDEDMEKAIRSWIKANTNAIRAGQQIVGVTLYEDTRL